MEMMDNLSKSLEEELITAPPTDSLQFVSDDSNIELSKRIVLLELENERFRRDLENVEIQLNAGIAANDGLKGKITELYVEVRSVLWEKQKLQNTLMDINGRLDIAEASVKTYQSQVHSLRASKKTLQLEIETYKKILQQRQRAIINLTARYKQLDMDYSRLLRKRQKEKEALEKEIHTLKIQQRSSVITEISNIATDMSSKLELTEDQLRDTKTEVKALEKQLSSNELSKILMENALTKQCLLISDMEENLYKCEIEKKETADILRKTRLEIQKLKLENETLEITLISSEQGQNQIQDAIFQLRMRLMEIIARYKLFKSKNTRAEERLNSLEDVVNENKRLKALLYKSNSSFIRRLRREKQKIRCLENQNLRVRRKENFNDTKMKTKVSLRECLKQVLRRNKDLKNQLRTLTKTSNESIDEGYGDNSIISSNSIDVPSPNLINPVLLNTASTLLLRCKDFYRPVQTELERLKLKFNRRTGEQCIT